MSTRHVIPAVAGSRAESSRSTTPPSGPGDPLDLLLGHLRDLIHADGAAFVVVDRERGSIEPAAQWYVSPDVQDTLLPALTSPIDRDLPGLAEAAMGRGTPLFLPRVEDWEAAPRLLREFESHPAPAAVPDAWERFASASVIACPVRTAIGRTLGVLLVVSLDPGRPLRKADRRVVEVLADLAALALERSQLLAAEGDRARRELMLKRAAEDMSGSLESDEVYRRVVDHAVSLTRSKHGRVSRLQPGRSRLVGVAGSGARDDDAFQPAVLGEVARSRRPVMDARIMHVPMALGPRLFGVLSVARTGEPAFGDGDLDLLQELARLGAAAMANAIDFERERRISRALTRGFVPNSVPEVPGYELGVLWEPAESQPTGGDLYGVWPLPGGEVGVLVGDVAGKGVETAALSAMARFFIEARSWDGEGPARVLAQANTMLRSRLPADTFVTAFFALLTREGLRYANAGHLSPLLLREGESELSEARGGGLPLGIDPTATYDEHTIEFAPGDLMLGFTDGLVEARRSGELFGGERLEQALIAASADAGDLDNLVRRVHADVHEWASGLSDDAALLAVRRSRRG
jgi:GAF domain-containing protein